MNSEPFTARPKLRELNDRDVNIANDPSPDFVETVVRQFAEAPLTIYATFDDDSMFACELTPHGLITMYKHSTVVATTLPNQVLSVSIGGQDGDFNRRFILPHVAVIAPVREFLLHHHTREELGWERQRADRPMEKLWPEEQPPKRIHLNAADIHVLFLDLPHDSEITTTRMRLRNKTILETKETFKARRLLAELSAANVSQPRPDGKKNTCRNWPDSS